jgi:hypothetical protein
MATDNVPNGNAPTPFVTNYDGAFFTPSQEGPPPAILFNPEAAPSELLPFAAARAERLRGHLHAWACAEAGELTEVASLLEPLAQEVTLILEEVRLRMLAESGQEIGGAA